jgi:hypothetical protein
MITAIETIYAGYRFRSRLEARFAIAQDYDGLVWEYEPEGFETPDGRYLPDFRVQVSRVPTVLENGKVRASRQPGPMWVEVKPPGYEDSREVIARWVHVAAGTGTPLLVAYGLDAGVLLILPSRELIRRPAPGRPPWMSDGAVATARGHRFDRHGAPRPPLRRPVPVLPAGCRSVEEWLMGVLVRCRGLDTAEGRVEALRKASVVVAQEPSENLRAQYIKFCSKRIGLDQEPIRRAVEQARAGHA